MKLRTLQHKIRLSQKRITRLNEKLAKATTRDGVCLGDDMDADLNEIITQEDDGIKERHPEGSFLRVFWDHQKEALNKHRKGMRWHPLMIRSVKQNNTNSQLYI